jgi:molybdopterin/thiamine biosynthesis adenylyltransferase
MTEATTTSPAPAASDVDRCVSERLANAWAVIAGTGNIGSHLVEPLIRAGFRRLRLIDRDCVEAKNLRNQAFEGASDVGRLKVEALAERVRAANPEVEVQAIAADLEDLPLGALDGVAVALGGLDSLRARQALVSELAYPQNVVTVDGAVDDDGAIGRVQVLVPGAACLECPWGEVHYRQLARETPCRPDGRAAGPPTNAPAALGAAVAEAMVREAAAVVGGVRPAASYEIAFDLSTGRRFRSWLKRAAGCRFDHVVVSESITLATPFAAATFGDLLAAARAVVGAGPVQLEFRRRLFDVGLFGGDRWLDADRMAKYASRRLAELGLERLDRIRVKAGARTAFVDLDRQGGD